MRIDLSHQGQCRLGTLSVALPPEGLVVRLGGEKLGQEPSPVSPTAAERAFAEAGDSDRGWVQELHQDTHLEPFLEAAPSWAISALDRSLVTLRGLQHRQSGLLVASPLTSVPQWPKSERAWDYRYAWIRDCALAGEALCRAGATAEAEHLGRGLEWLLERDQLRPVTRLTGGHLPPEHRLPYLGGYGGSPVRIGNAADEQVQLDALGELLVCIGSLARLGTATPGLLSQASRLADHVAANWQLPDHGIWEVRGEPQPYVHSKVMAWAGLRAAGRMAGASQGWLRIAGRIRAAIERRGRGPDGGLQIALDKPRTDASLLEAYLVGYVRPSSPGAARTLDAVLGELAHGPLVARHHPERDGIESPCFPFVFPGLWAASVEGLLGRSGPGRERLRRIVALAGPAGQLSEVADPDTAALWGNYPQVQSHAALIDALLRLWPARDRGTSRANLY